MVVLIKYTVFCDEFALPITFAPHHAGEPAPWEDEIECKLFSPPIGGVGPSNEVRQR